MSPVKIDISKTYFSTGRTRYYGQIIAQPKLKIKLLNTPTTTEHQVLQLTTKLDYSKMNQEVTTNNFVLYLFFSPNNGSKINFFLDCRVSYSLTYNNGNNKHPTY